jgi:hypothetical protein
VGCVLLFGLVLAALDGPIYEAFEGRALWPAWLYRIRQRRWQGYVDRVVRRAAGLPEDDWRKAECWNVLQRFPRNADGDFVATRPTLLGNVLASYENYSERVYGMNAVAFWQRLWLRLDKDVRDELDRLWAPTDGLVYTSAALMAVGLFYVVIAALSAVSTNAGTQVFLFSDDERAVSVYAGFLIAFLGLVPYRISIGGHSDNGDAMKSVFDMFRDRLGTIEIPTDAANRSRNELIAQWFTYGDGVRPVRPPTKPRHRGLAKRILDWIQGP